MNFVISSNLICEIGILGSVSGFGDSISFCNCLRTASSNSLANCSCFIFISASFIIFCFSKSIN
ncbi:hypothetical protein [Candidatus Phytoplasma sp. AldY-WA1]|uniref:hypothetical protein n=1 Tax=Candidatus Phytoplasma sp. AldY-WA1 TaxID=2852100 RepID=UPI00254D5D95|nr:hypothetical protein [Candidatus Phytoplasma sp. AldY-WA1]